MDGLIASIGAYGTIGYVVFGLVVLFLLWKIMYYTVKKVVIHLILGYIAYFVATHFFHIPIDMGFIMWGLTALFGPIPVIIVAIWHWL